jgi:hypothetical protein
MSRTAFQPGDTPAGRHRRMIAALLGSLLLAAGCTSVRPDRINVDRIDYGQVIAESWKRQTLLNVVRLRYADAPVFLEVASLINSYTMGGTASAGASLPSAIDPNVFNLSTQGIWSNSPTVTYQPLIGDRFTRSLLQPITPTAIFQMLQAGWSANLVLSTAVSSINGLRNVGPVTEGDPGYREMVDALTRIQRAGAIGMRVEPHKEGSTIVLVMRRGAVDKSILEDGRRVRELLGLEQGPDEFEITFGLLPRNNREIAVLSRSMMEIMLNLGAGVEVPAEHLGSGRASPGRPADSQAAVLVRIHSGSAAPSNTYAAVQFKDYWYWIDDTDTASKRIFTFLMLLFSLAETGQPAAVPVVTVPSR